MRQRFNYTGRQQIKRKDIHINLIREGDDVKSFDATIDLGSYDFFPDARVFLDAYRKDELLRFDFGTAKNIQSPSERDLSSFAYGTDVMFRLLVVDESRRDGLILGQADKISPEKGAESKSILHCQFVDLGQQIWKLDFPGADGMPVLLINQKIPKHIPKNDPQFFMYVYPAVIREILSHMVFTDGVDSPEEPSTDWHEKWIKFARRFSSGEKIPEVLHPSSDAFICEEAEKWIANVVEEFCDTRKEWNSFINLIRG